MARLSARFLFVLAAALPAGACSNDSPSAPSRTPAPPERPAPSLPPLAEGRYRLQLTAAGPSMGCELTVPGIGLGGGPPLVAGAFGQDVQLRYDPAGWTIAPESSDPQTTLRLLVNSASWPASPVVSGVLSGIADQRAYDGPALDAGGRDRPASFVGAVLNVGTGSNGVTFTVSDTIVLTGTVNGRLTFSSGWTGSVTTCNAAQLVLQRP